MKKLVIILTIVVVGKTSFAQDLHFGYFQKNHNYILNPAMVVHDPEQVFLEYGRKWAGLASPPEEFQVGGVFHSSKRLSFAGLVNRSASGVLNMYHYGISTGYKVNLAPKQTLSAGLSTYLKNNIIDTDNIVGNLSDPVLNGGNYNRAKFGLGVGLTYSYDKLIVNFALPETHSDNNEFNPFISGGASYVIPLNDFKVTPSVTYFGAPVDRQVEGMVMASWKNTLTAGLGYRTNNTVGVRVEFQSGPIALGYAFANPIGGFSGTGVSNNFSVRFLFRRTGADNVKKLSTIEDTNQRILNRLNADKDSARQVQSEILRKLDLLTNQQDTVRVQQRDFLDKFEEAERNNTVDEATKQEVEPGYYLVIYSFHNSTELTKIKEELTPLPFETKLIHDKEKSQYYIATRRYDTLEMAVIAMQNIRNRGFDGAWIHWYK
ncbi:MAG: type IX secretion system membrane protein PorP/SprF [Imperialibacter sp.]|uniref:type IX secretion system membrane protein PorP/SprF n=1 Tax=Imperialibacter sp. TaxID=2038411 RepID=UPI0032F06397